MILLTSKTSSALQSCKWQLIDMGWWYHSTLSSYLSASMDLLCSYRDTWAPVCHIV